MMRWNLDRNEETESPELDAKLQQILDLCKSLGISIGHEDEHGAFIIRDWDENNAEWLMEAHDGRAKPCSHPRLNMDGICYACGQDCRGGS